MKNPLQKTIAAMMLTFKMILCLNDNWETYLKNCNYEVWEVEKREVEKMLSCMDRKSATQCICAVTVGKQR